MFRELDPVDYSGREPQLYQFTRAQLEQEIMFFCQEGTPSCFAPAQG